MNFQSNLCKTKLVLYWSTVRFGFPYWDLDSFFLGFFFPSFTTVRGFFFVFLVVVAYILRILQWMLVVVAYIVARFVNVLGTWLPNDSLSASYFLIQSSCFLSIAGKPCGRHDFFRFSSLFFRGNNENELKIYSASE